VTVLATIGIVWAVVELCVAVSVMITGQHRPAPRPTTMPTYSHSSSGNVTVYNYHVAAVSTVRRRSSATTVIYNFSRWLLAGLLLPSSIGALRLRPWGRQGLIVWAWSSLAVITWQLAYALLSLSVTLSRMSRHAQINLIIIYLMILSFQLFPIWILATFGTPRVKSAFGK
jgi:hypothetical protein